MAKAYDRDGGGGGSAGLRDIYLRHGINLTRYSTHEARKLIGILDTANTQIKGIITKAKAIETKEKYRRVSAEIKRLSNDLGKQLNGQLEIDFKALAEEETRFVEKAIRSVNVTADFELPAPQKIWTAASFGTYAGYGSKETYDSYLNKLSDDLFKTWDSNVRAGYLAGLTAQQINRAVLGSVKDMEPGQMQGLRRSLEMNTRTMIAHLAETARDETYKKNSRLFSGFRYIATLDSRTCLECGTLDGKVFEGSEVPDDPELPQHPNCRCLWLPEIKGMEGFDDDDERASVDGPVSANMSYEDWLKTQPDEVVRDILGPTRFDMYKNGAEISAFVVDGRTLSIKELEATIDFAEDQIKQNITEFDTDGLSVDEFRKAMTEKMKKIGAEINEDGTVNLYHITTPDIAKKINEQGFFKPSNAPISGGIGTDYGPSSFFGITREYTKQWGDSGRSEIIKVRVPVEYIRQGTGDPNEVYFEGGLKKQGEIWIPAQKPQSTFYDRRIVKNYIKELESNGKYADPSGSESDSKSQGDKNIYTQGENLEETLSNVENKMKELTEREDGVIINKDGKILNVSKGTEHEVSPPERLIKDNIFTHNHPSGGCFFSKDDIENYLKARGHELRAITRDGRFVSLKKGTGEIDNKLSEDFNKEFGSELKLSLKADLQAMQKYGQKRTSAQITHEAENIVNKWLLDNQKKYNYIFNKGKI